MISALADLISDLLQALEPSAGHHHSRSGSSEYCREAAAESGCGACYQRDLTGELCRGVRKRKPIGRAHDRHHNHFCRSDPRVVCDDGPTVDGSSLPVLHTANSLIALGCNRAPDWTQVPGID
jgi:hypothetical protein